MSTVPITHLGCIGHFIGAERCKWRRHTQVGTAYRVSTVGDYCPPSLHGKRETLGIGPDTYFETMVFCTTSTTPYDDSEGCGCLPCGWEELTCRRYATAGEAQRGHDEVVAEYARRVEKEEQA